MFQMLIHSVVAMVCLIHVKFYCYMVLKQIRHFNRRFNNLVKDFILINK